MITPTLYGRHNLLNTLAVIAIAATLDMNAKEIAEAVASFKGVRRRMEVFLEAQGVIFVDDFAHHPTAIRETIAAAKMRWPKRRLRAVFEPRSNTTVTNRFQHELEEAFSQADEVLLGPVHRINSIPLEQRLDRSALVGTFQKNGIPAAYYDDVNNMADAILFNAKPGDVVLFMSNGAFGGVYGKIKDNVAEST